ncbi:hypothetical protein ASZ90_020304 [hydrocarbon metagenome]|uniref:Putative zinc-finger domain-containing protein n=1 Tax=hydrocarbon metagenome TaxID=938273 RepID=A0A0W8E103_9ZZZZ
MNCKEAKNFISPYMDGELEGNSALEFIAHLEECESCRQSYQEMVQISGLFRSAGKTIIPAPDGFKDSVMQRIAEKPGSGRSAVLVGFSRRWKQMAASAAAVALLAFTSYTYALPPLIQLAEHEQTPIVSSDSGDKVDPVDKTDLDIQPSNGDSSSDITDPGDIDTTQPGTDVSDKDPVVNDPDPQSGDNAPVLLSADQQNIKTTLLKIAARAEMSSSYDKAVSSAQSVGAQTEKLGQQSKDDIIYQQVNIIVARDNEAALLSSLRSLGDIISEQEDYKDISTAYQNTVDQYNNLTQQKADSDDAEEIQRLESEINSLNDKLGAFKQQAEKVTIVLWLQQ